MIASVMPHNTKKELLYDEWWTSSTMVKLVKSKIYQNMKIMPSQQFQAEHDHPGRTSAS
jgi:hypothetical protein